VTICACVCFEMRKLLFILIYRASTEAHDKKSIERQLKQESEQTKHLRAKCKSSESRSASIRQLRQERVEAEARADEAEFRADGAEFRAADLQRDLNVAKMEVGQTAARCACACMSVSIDLN